MANASAGNHTISASVLDSAGNSATESVSFNIIDSENKQQEANTTDTSNNDTYVNTPQASNDRPQSERVLAVTGPSSGEEITGSIPVSASIPIRMRKEGVSIAVMARKIGGKKQSIYSIAGSAVPQSGMIHFAWNPSEKGEYALYVQVVGKARDFSTKVRVIAK